MKVEVRALAEGLAKRRNYTQSTFTGWRVDSRLGYMQHDER